ncbi:unnamed protein product, partial [Closterium sp. NIES-64]
MRIVIEVDVSAEEIPLATHLFSALRAIADDVRARNLRPVFEALIARLRDPAELDSVARDVRTLLGEGAGVGESGEKGGVRGSGGGSKSGSGNGEEKEGAADGAKANEDPLDAFVAAFLHVVFETDLLAQKISVVPFMRLVPSAVSVAAFLHVVFETDLLAQKLSVVPFMRPVPWLPDTAKVKMRDTLIPKVGADPQVPDDKAARPTPAGRSSLSMLRRLPPSCNLEFVSIQGAVTTILTLLRKPDNRCAAVTMLGKTVELCAPQVRLTLPHPMCSQQQQHSTQPQPTNPHASRKPGNRCALAAVTMPGKTVELCAPPGRYIPLCYASLPDKPDKPLCAAVTMLNRAFPYIPHMAFPPSNQTSETSQKLLPGEERRRGALE